MPLSAPPKHMPWLDSPAGAGTPALPAEPEPVESKPKKNPFYEDESW